MVRRPAGKIAQDTDAPGAPRGEPTTWWRVSDAGTLDAGDAVAMRAALAGTMLFGEARWKAAVAGDAAAAIGAAIAVLKANVGARRFDLAMTALAACAASSNPVACLVLSNLLRRCPGAGPVEARLATSWLVRAFGEGLFAREKARASEVGGT